LSGIGDKELLGSSALTITRTQDDQALSIVLSVASGQLTTAKSYFANIYGDRFTYISASAARAASDARSEPSASLSEQIEKLADLHERGLLSEAEYAAAKAKLLG
jgi:hypothetical protein